VADVEEPREPLEGRIEVDYRLRGTFLSKLRVQDPQRYAAQQPDLEKRFFGLHRLRLGASVRYNHDGMFLDRIAARVQGDAWDGRPWGNGGVANHALTQFWAHPRQQDGAFGGGQLRRLNVEFTTAVGVLRVGRDTSRWGLGILANGGEDDATDLRGDQLHGDIVDRLLVATRPLALAGLDVPLNVAVAVDRVVDDDTVDLSGDRYGPCRRPTCRHPGDRAFNVIGALLYDGASVQGGTYVAWRSAENREGDDTRATAIDGFVRYEMPDDAEDPPLLRPYAAAEFVLVTGWTDIARSTIVPKRSDVQQFGGVAQVGAHLADFTFGADVGFASGDGNPFDARQNAFSMDRDFRVGLILFREYLAAATAAGAFHLRDPGGRDVPSDGSELLPTNGSVRNAVFAQVGVEWRPVEDLGTRLSGLWARAPRPVLDPFASFADSQATGLRGASPGGRNYGWELDISARYRILLERPGIATLVQGGVFFPGDAFEDPQGHVPAPVYLVTFGLDLSW
jgi:hypothetical protein